MPHMDGKMYGLLLLLFFSHFFVHYFWKKEPSMKSSNAQVSTGQMPFLSDNKCQNTK